MEGTRSVFWQRPRTRLGWWSVGLLILFTIMSILNTSVFMRLPEDTSWRQTVLPYYGIAMIVCGLAAGVVGLIAVLRNRERSWMIWMTIMAGATVLVFVLGELLAPH